MHGGYASEKAGVVSAGPSIRAADIAALQREFLPAASVAVAQISFRLFTDPADRSLAELEEHIGTSSSAATDIMRIETPGGCELLTIVSRIRYIFMLLILTVR